MRESEKEREREKEIEGEKDGGKCVVMQCEE